mgnify:FL=1
MCHHKLDHVDISTCFKLVIARENLFSLPLVRMLPGKIIMEWVEFMSATLQTDKHF